MAPSEGWRWPGRWPWNPKFCFWTSRPDRADYAAAAVQDIPAHRLGQTSEVAAICAFLCSPAARYINGASLIADGAGYMGNWTPMLDPDV